jgi:hypothetical protein
MGSETKIVEGLAEKLAQRERAEGSMKEGRRIDFAKWLWPLLPAIGAVYVGLQNIEINAEDIGELEAEKSDVVWVEDKLEAERIWDEGEHKNIRQEIQHVKDHFTDEVDDLEQKMDENKNIILQAIRDLERDGG